MKKIFFLLVLLTGTAAISNAQFLMDMLDTTKESGKGLLNIYRNFDHLQIGGYMQPQFQVIQEIGSQNF